MSVRNMDTSSKSIRNLRSPRTSTRVTSPSTKITNIMKLGSKALSLTCLLEATN